jgi:pimeloyl-ACP methyl ester carboxylesterase
LVADVAFAPNLLARRRFLLSAAAAVAAPLGNSWAVAGETRRAVARDGGVLVNTGGIDVNVRNGGRGPALVMIHGFGAALDWWDGIAPRLEDRHRVVRLDLIGHGGTTAPLDGYGIETQAMMTAGVMDRLGIGRAVVVGHSMGGEVAAALCAARPDRIDGVVLIGTPASADVTFDVMTRLYLTPVLGELLSRVRTRAALRRGLAQAFAPGFAVPERFVADLLQVTDPAFRQAHAASTAFRKQRPVDERLAALARPPRLLVVFGGGDAIVPTSEAERYARVPGAEIVVLPAVGHSPMVEVPERTHRLIASFLAGAA